MVDEHDDDLEPEVGDGADMETENYADVAEEVEEEQPAVEAEDDEGEAPDTI